MDRPCTPPSRSLCPPTPPPTERFSKRNHFENTGYHRRTTVTKKAESLTEFFEESQKGSCIDITKSGGEAGTSINSNSPVSSASDAPYHESEIPAENDFSSILATFSKAPVVTEPFPLLQLTVSLRNKVYEHLLVIPGIIFIYQNHTASHSPGSNEIYTQDRVLLPGISHALIQLTVNGPRIPFSRFASTNINILLTSKEVLAEARAVLYTKNAFEIIRPSTELIPPCDFRIRLFPPGCQRLVTKLHIRIRSFYSLHWLLGGGYSDVKNFYRALNILTVILEFESVAKGFARQWARNEGESWDVYLARSRVEISKNAFTTNKVAAGKVKQLMVIPKWINLRVLFAGESYEEKLGVAAIVTAEQQKRDELRNALVEAWESLKKVDH